MLTQDSVNAVARLMNQTSYRSTTALGSCASDAEAIGKRVRISFLHAIDEATGDMLLIPIYPIDQRSAAEAPCIARGLVLREDANADVQIVEMPSTREEAEPY